MRYITSLTMCLLFLIIQLITSCNDGTKTNVPDNYDSTSTAASITGNKPNYDTSRSVTAISPNLYRKLADTLNIKMLEGVYEPGDSSIMHAHPDFALYVLEGSKVELTMADNSKQVIDFKKGMAIVLPATNHSAKNIGNTTLRVIVAEVDRPRD